MYTVSEELLPSSWIAIMTTCPVNELTRWPVTYSAIAAAQVPAHAPVDTPLTFAPRSPLYVSHERYSTVVRVVGSNTARLKPRLKLMEGNDSIGSLR